MQQKQERVAPAFVGKWLGHKFTACNAENSEQACAEECE
jgi:hypothetical protein